MPAMTRMACVEAGSGESGSSTICTSPKTAREPICFVDVDERPVPGLLPSRSAQPLRSGATRGIAGSLRQTWFRNGAASTRKLKLLSSGGYVTGTGGQPLQGGKTGSYGVTHPVRHAGGYRRTPSPDGIRSGRMGMMGLPGGLATSRKLARSGHRFAAVLECHLAVAEKHGRWSGLVISGQPLYRAVRGLSVMVVSLTAGRAVGVRAEVPD